jgi:hypothetical protein
MEKVMEGRIKNRIGAWGRVEIVEHNRRCPS